jgi:hypothetical protein
MKLVPDPLVVEETDGYQEKFAIDRSQFGGFLTDLVRKTKEPLVIAIDGRWGEGKTTFVKIWQNQLECRGPWKVEEDKKVATLYIDAFKLEAYDDIFVSLVAEIDAFVRARCGSKAKLDEFKRMAIKIGAKLIPIAAKAVVKVATLNAIDPDSIVDLQVDRNVIASSLSDQAEKILSDRLQALIDNKAAIEDFQQKLKELPEAIQDNPSKQLLIIIDELDRCSPKYAVDFLEKIKHFFSTENIKFVLVINKNQIEESIRANYGQGIKAGEYLQKFIDVEASLPRDSAELNKSETFRFCDSLFDRHDFTQDDLAVNFKRFVSEFAYHAKLPLRQIEKIFVRFALVKSSDPRSFSSWDALWHNLIAYVCIVKVLDQEHFEDFGNQTVSGSKVQQFFSRELKGAKYSKSFSDKMEEIEYICMNEVEFEKAGNKKTKEYIGFAINCDEQNRTNLIATIYRVISTFDLR